MMNFNKTFYNIGEVADALAIPAYVLRFWESKFKQINPKKARGRRYYNRETIQKLAIIKKLLYQDNYSISDANKILAKINLTSEKPKIAVDKPVKQISSAELVSKIDDLQQKLTAAKAKLESALKA